MRGQGGVRKEVLTTQIIERIWALFFSLPRGVYMFRDEFHSGYQENDLPLVMHAAQYFFILYGLF